MKKLFIATAGLLILIALNGCKKEDSTNDSIFGTVTDIDGNTYKTVKIGTQTWMMENLRTAHYNDGTAIPNVTGSQQWYDTGNANLSGAYCNYNNDTNNDTIYGKLYNWYAVGTEKLAPTGWHVPSKAEYEILIDYLDGDNNTQNLAGPKLSAQSSLWGSSASSATNSSYFSALPAGERRSGSSAVFSYIGQWAMFWTSDVVAANGADNRYGNYLRINNVNGVDFQIPFKVEGLSVRCIKN